MYEKEVARGAAWLDEKQPGWEGKINAEKLVMHRGSYDQVTGEGCIICQLSMSFFYDTLYKLGIPHGAAEWAAAHGFVLLGDVGKALDNYPQLEETWIALLKERYNNGTLSG